MFKWLVLLPVCLYAQVQFWTLPGAEVKYGPYSGKVEGEFHVVDSDLNYGHVDVAISKKIGSLTPTVAYRAIKEEKGTEWKLEQRPSAAVTVSGVVKGFKLQNRSRVEIRIRENTDEVWRYVDRVKAAYSVLGMEPYLSVEPYYDFLVNEINQNRVVAGSSILVKERFRLEAAYMFKSDMKNSVWTSTNVLTVGMTYTMGL